jgi:hypothetical protein
VEYQSKLHGFYVNDKRKHEEYLLIDPDPRSEVDSPLKTQIDLPASGTPSCKVAINGRCLLELKHIYAASTQDGKDIFGRVTFTGNIRRDGIVSDLAVADATADPPELRSVLVDEAMQNLRTWRFAPAKNADAFRITYDYRITDSPLVGYEHSVEFHLPDEVRVWTPSQRLRVPPQVISSTPSSGTGIAQAFTFLLSHPAGFSAITQVRFVISSTSSRVHCEGLFKTAAHALYLAEDESGLLGPMDINGSGSLQNSACIVNSAGSSVASSGDKLALTVSLAFKPAFAGPKIISIQTVSGQRPDPNVEVGTWTAP